MATITKAALLENWKRVEADEFKIPLPSQDQGKVQLWQQEMHDVENRRVAFLYQTVCKSPDRASQLLELAGSITDLQFGRLLRVTDQTLEVSKVTPLTVENLITTTFRDRNAGGQYGSFSVLGTPPTLADRLSHSEIDTLTPLFQRYIKNSLNQTNLLRALHLPPSDETNPKVILIRTIAWHCFMEGAQVRNIDATYAGYTDSFACKLSKQEADNIARAARKANALSTLVIKGYCLSEEAVETLRGSGKKIDIDHSTVEAPWNMTKLAVGFVAIIVIFGLASFICSPR